MHYWHHKRTVQLTDITLPIGLLNQGFTVQKLTTLCDTKNKDTVITHTQHSQPNFINHASWFTHSLADHASQ